MSDLRVCTERNRDEKQNVWQQSNKLCCSDWSLTHFGPWMCYITRETDKWGKLASFELQKLKYTLKCILTQNEPPPSLHSPAAVQRFTLQGFWRRQSWFWVSCCHELVSQKLYIVTLIFKLFGERVCVCVTNMRLNSTRSGTWLVF